MGNFQQHRSEGLVGMDKNTLHENTISPMMTHLNEDDSTPGLATKRQLLQLFDFNNDFIYDYHAVNVKFFHLINSYPVL